jgi:hypothetical protein
MRCERALGGAMREGIGGGGETVRVGERTYFFPQLIQPQSDTWHNRWKRNEANAQPVRAKIPAWIRCEASVGGHLL